MPKSDTVIVIRADNRTGQAFRQIIGNADKLDKKSKQLNNNFSNLSKTIFGIGSVALAGALAKSVVDITDKYKRLNSQIKLVTDNTSEQVKITKDLFAVAQDTRQAYESTVLLFTRVARNTKNLNIEQSKLIDLTRITNQALQIGGQTATESAAGVIQFSQALATGRLASDEFRSVMENMPRLARAIADGLGVPFGKLRELSRTGELTAERVIRALLDQGDILDQEFGKLEITVESVMTTIRNEVERTIAGVDSTEIVDALISFREELAKPETIQAIRNFASVTITSLEAILFAFTGVIGAAQDFGKELGNAVAGPGGRNFNELLERRAQLLERIETIASGARGNPEAPQNLDQMGALTEELMAVARLVGTYEQLRTVKDEVNDENEDTGESSKLATALSDEQKAIQKIIKAVQKQAATVGMSAAEIKAWELRQLGAGDAVASLIQKTLEQVEAEKKAIETKKQLNKETEQQEKKINDVLISLEAELAATKAGEGALRRLAAARKLGAGATDEQIKQAARLQLEIDKINEKAGEQEDQFKDLENTINGWSRSFADALLDGEGNFKSFAGTIIRELARIALARATEPLFNAFADVIGSVAGGFLSSSTGGLTEIDLSTLPQRRATGGPVQAGKPFIIGERGPELMVPGSNGTVIPNNKLGGGNTFNITVNANNADASTVIRLKEVIKAELLPQAVKASTNATFNTLSRPGFS